ncbi:Gfo/Idh/MocA family oxidoreductase [Streptomyces sp. NPDC059002]|uniref:Gfo/Idh/MocA family oxidoreductase n=1 Tax=Streptomyces sp. NPDC059002 TaxID=3346690 RepID=UPI003684B023
MTGPPLRAGLIGLGVMGCRHARVLQSLPGVTLVGAVDPAGDRYRAVTGTPVVATTDELLTLGIDYAVLACPTSLHEAIGLKLAAHALPVLIEKPLAASAAAAQRLQAAFAAATVPAAVGHIERFHPALQALRTHLRTGKLGTIHYVATRRQGPRPRRITDVGVLQDTAVHDIDTTQWLTGDTYTALDTHVRRCANRPHEDLAVLAGRLTGGSVTSHVVSWLSPFRERLTTVTGDRGCLHADTLTERLTYHPHHGSSTHIPLPSREPLLAEHLAFHALLRTGRTDVLATLEEGALVVAHLQSALQRSRRPGTGH